jgi:hypothetical protein
MLFRRTPKVNEHNLPEELSRAARSLEDRFQILGLPACKFPQAEWDALPQRTRAVIPAWVPALLSNYTIAGVWLEFESFERDSVARMFAFQGPASLAQELAPGSEAWAMVEFGFFPLGFEEGSGSLWLATAADGPSGNIYLLDLTNWAGGKPTPGNGLFYAHRSLACFLSAMAVSNANDGKGFWNEK